MGSEIPTFYVFNDGICIIAGANDEIVLMIPYDVWDGMVDFATKARDPQKLESLPSAQLGKPRLDFDQLLKEIRDAKDK